MSAPSRRAFLRGALGGAGGLAAAAASLAPLGKGAATGFSLERLLQPHYLRMTPEELKQVLARVEAEVLERHGVRAEVNDHKALPGVEFAFALDIDKCVGCRRCVHACAAENNASRDPEIQYIRVLELPEGSLDLAQGDHHYEHERLPRAGRYYLPIQCQQCADPPCVSACPVGATWQEPDGVVVIDYDWCIGCRLCMAACPYWARRFNFAPPAVPSSALNARMDYLANRPRSAGVVEKCHFCLHRTRAGLQPACVEACPNGARKFGDVLDEGGELAWILAHKRVFVLKPELGTLPRFYYYAGEDSARASPAAPGPDRE
ncbi:MAG: 4Fe-4S dicluster domain-containing protein [Planctomycetes bacterium]|nr:4Fe-4S dicluster domain-containing protein [Planctomycetota bacterium]